MSRQSEEPLFVQSHASEASSGLGKPNEQGQAGPLPASFRSKANRMFEHRELSSVHLTSVELACRWHTTPGAIRTMRWRGSAPPTIKVGKKLLFRLADVEAFEAAHESQSTSEGVRS